MPLDRRRFLQLTAARIVAGVAGSACAAGADSAASDRPTLLSMLGPDRVRELGTHYRSATPSENSVGALRAALSDTSRAKIPGFHASVDDKIRDDFAAGRTVLVDGWVLSLTEARQSALFSLTNA
jgi:hypothetical protein